MLVLVIRLATIIYSMYINTIKMNALSVMITFSKKERIAVTTTKFSTPLYKKVGRHSDEFEPSNGQEIQGLSS